MTTKKKPPMTAKERTRVLAAAAKKRALKRQYPGFYATRDATVKAAVATGRILAARVGYWNGQYDLNPVETTERLRALQPVLLASNNPTSTEDRVWHERHLAAGGKQPEADLGWFDTADLAASAAPLTTGTSNTTHLASAASADDLGWFDAADLEADIAASAPAETPTTNNTASSDDDGWFS